MATNEQRQDCWDKAVHAFGTAYIFEQRSNKARKKLRWLSFLGIAVPVLVGGIVVAFFGVDQLKPYLSWLIVLAGLLGTIQLVITIWSLIAKWEDEAIYGSESNVGNYEISKLYADLARNNPDDFDSKYELLNLRNDLRSAEDSKKEITEKENTRILMFKKEFRNLSSKELESKLNNDAFVNDAKQAIKELLKERKNQ